MIEPRDAREEQQRRPGGEDQRRLADIGLQQQAGDDHEHDARVAMVRAGIALLLHALGEQPGADHREGRLHELGGLDRSARQSEIQRRAPLTSMPNFSVSPQQHDADDEHAERPEARRARAAGTSVAISTGDGRDAEQRVADDEMPGTRGQAARRPAGSRQSSAPCRQTSSRTSAASNSRSIVHHHSAMGVLLLA